jgi:hypothetical protein
VTIWNYLKIKIYENIVLENEIFIDTDLIEKFRKSIKGIKINEKRYNYEQNIENLF